MSRKLVINIHLYLAAFFAPMVVIMAFSGGLYLLGVKGSIEKETVAVVPVKIDTQSPDLEQQVRDLLQEQGLNSNFQYLKHRGENLDTRPTNRQFYQLLQRDDGLHIVAAKPDLIAALVELHKGHGPTLYKQFEIAFSMALVVIMLSGLYLGLASKGLKTRTMQLSLSGTALFLILALLA